MTNWSLRKRFETNSFPVHSKKRRKKMFCCSDNTADDKENSMNYNNVKTNEMDSATQYLYADPSFIMQLSDKPEKRLEGGGVGVAVSGEQDLFYDCECEPEPQLQIFEIINEIKNPREFKSLLKQMAYTSSVLYRSFRQAYSKTKKQNLCEKPCQHMDCGDMNPLDIINIEIPHNRQEHLEEVRYDSFQKVKRKKKKSSSPQKYTKDQFASCQNNENMCDICLDPAKPEADICCLKEEDFNEINKMEQIPKSSNKQECDFSNWFPPDPPCLVEGNVCQQYNEELKHLDFCERCAVLRGEMPLPSNMPTDVESQIWEQSSQTCQKMKSSKNETCSKSSRPLKQTAKQVLNLNPVCVTIPLKLQIDSQNCQSRFIETEIVMEAFPGTQSKPTTCISKPQPPQRIIPTFTNPSTFQTPTSTAVTTNKLQEKNGSDLFYSCVSTSGIIIPNETQPIPGETSLNEVLDIIKKRMPTSEEIPTPLPEITSKTIGTRMTLPESVMATTMTAPIDPSTRMDFTQTEQATLPTPPQLDHKMKAQQLRADLLGEVRAALQQTTPIAALKALMEGKRFSLPTDLRPKETSNIKTPDRHSMPSNYQALASTAPTLQPLKPLTTPSAKPDLPPKHNIPNKPVSLIPEIVQTDVSGIKATGHYKRNEMRNEIQEELKDLLEPNPSKSKTKYAPEERDEILLDLHKLFHPERAGRLPKQISRENALQDISYLVKPETSLADATSPQTSETQDSIIQSIKHILNPKSQQKAKKKKYDKETKEKILEDLQIILTPRQKKTEVNEEIRASVLHDLRFMLDTGLESTSPHRPPRLSQLPAASLAETGPSSSRAQEIRQQRQQKPPNEIRDSLIADLRYLLDTTHPSQATGSNTLEQNVTSTRPAVRKPDVPAKPKKPNEESLPDDDKSKEKRKVEPAKLERKRKQINNKTEDINLPITKSSSSDTFFLEMQDQHRRSSQQRNK